MYYTPEQILADPALSAVVQDADINPAHLDVSIQFASTADWPVKIAGLPPGRFSRLVVLTDRSPYPATLVALGWTAGSFPLVGLSFGAVYNQRVYDAANDRYIYYFSPFSVTRGANGFAGMGFEQAAFGTPTTGDLSTMADVVDYQPYPADINWE